MSLYTRVLRHIDMDRVKELREENIKKQKIAEAKLQEEIISAELERIYAEQTKHCNWRIDLEEGMTTAGLGMINLEPSPNVLSNETSAFDSESSEVATVVSGGAVKLGVDEGQPFTDLYPGSANTQLRQASFIFDSTKYDTLVINITNPGGGQGEWCDPDCGFDNIVRYSVFGVGDKIQATGTLSNGDNTIKLPSNVRVNEMEVHIGQFASNGVYSDGYNPPFTINSISTKRLTPINVFVSLDDPDATAFIRDTVGNQKLSPKEKKKKLEEMLGASAEYLNKMFGEGMPRTATQIADYEPQQSFTQISALDTIPYEEPSPGPGGYKSPGSYDSDKFYDLKNDPSQFPSPNLPSTGPGLSDKGGDTKIAAEYPRPDPLDKLLKDINDADKRLKNQAPGSTPGKGRGMGDRWDFNKFVKGKANTMVAHHEPQGEVIVEKKRLKSPSSLLDKIPGYYDGKPAPLGFPIEEPPKMVNGKHPDLVDGKKVSKRYNRLDPISAKAMPKTGNPHIDKKVRAAAKRPK